MMLTFKLKKGINCNYYKIFNQENQFLGEIRRKRVGRFRHFVFCPVAVKTTGDLWFTNGCLKEISEFITKQYRKTMPIHLLVDTKTRVHYLCNQATSTTPEKGTHDKTKVTCKNCEKIIKVWKEK